MRPETRLRSTAMRIFSSAKYLEYKRAKARVARQLRREPQRVHYFHQADDPYSHLVVQKLDELQAAYRLPFRTHLVAKPDAAFQGSSDHFDHWALRDAVSVARDYGTSFADHPNEIPSPEALAAANNALAPHLGKEDFAQTAVSIGEALWSGQLAESGQDNQAGARAVTSGNQLRKSLGHYLGGMFYFEGEWFWGIDRIRLLEERLAEEGFAADPTLRCVPEPTAVDTTGLNASDIVVEYFPSLRSPYTAIGHQRVLALVARSGVSVKVRPVMPMLMRGVPAPQAKQQYIITDAGREARARNVPFGHIVDPFGEPVKRAFALFPGAVALDKGMDFVTAYLSAAWSEGIDITVEKGLRQVAANALISWDQLQEASRNAQWENLLNDNLNNMLEAGLWGVPSFRLSGGKETGGNDSGQDNEKNSLPYACWGQDRIWRVENEIAKRA